MNIRTENSHILIKDEDKERCVTLALDAPEGCVVVDEAGNPGISKTLLDAGLITTLEGYVQEGWTRHPVYRVGDVR